MMCRAGESHQTERSQCTTQNMKYPSHILWFLKWGLIGRNHATFCFLQTGRLHMCSRKIPMEHQNGRGNLWLDLVCFVWCRLAFMFCAEQGWTVLCRSVVTLKPLQGTITVRIRHSALSWSFIWILRERRHWRFHYWKTWTKDELILHTTSAAAIYRLFWILRLLQIQFLCNQVSMCWSVDTDWRISACFFFFSNSVVLLHVASIVTLCPLWLPQVESSHCKVTLGLVKVQTPCHEDLLHLHWLIPLLSWHHSTENEQTLDRYSCTQVLRSFQKTAGKFVDHKKNPLHIIWSNLLEHQIFYMMNLTSFLRLQRLLLLTTLKRLGRTLIFIVPSAPQEKMWLVGPTSICMTPVPRFLNSDWRACSLGKV